VHDTHAAAVELPVFALTDPAVHGVHAELLGAEENRPVAHVVHSEAAARLNVPAEHTKQADARSPLNCPATQLTQAVAEELSVLPFAVPAAHETQVVLPGCAAYAPCGQPAQDSAPAAE
jgi:hypothetical protein